MSDSGRTDAATVFITNMAADHDYESATKFGAIRPVTRGNFPFFKHVRLIEEIAETLVHSSKTDYLAFSGSGFIGALCLNIWLIMHRECRALLFDRQQGGYILRVIKRDALVINIEKAKDAIPHGRLP